jgi:hypothetical protein
VDDRRRRIRLATVARVAAVAGAIAVVAGWPRLGSDPPLPPSGAPEPVVPEGQVGSRPEASTADEMPVAVGDEQKLELADGGEERVELTDGGEERVRARPERKSTKKRRRHSRPPRDPVIRPALPTAASRPMPDAARPSGEPEFRPFG